MKKIANCAFCFKKREHSFFIFCDDCKNFFDQNIKFNTIPPSFLKSLFIFIRNENFDNKYDNGFTDKN